MNKRELARETKKLANNPNARLQVTQTKRGFRAYTVYGNEHFEDDADEVTIGFIHQPLTLKELGQWFRFFVKGTDGRYLRGY